MNKCLKDEDDLSQNHKTRKAHQAIVCLRGSNVALGHHDGTLEYNAPASVIHLAHLETACAEALAPALAHDWEA